MTVAQFLEKNLWAILSAGIMALLAYVIGTTQTAATLADLTKRLDKIENRMDASAKYQACATRYLDALQRGDPKAPECELEVM